MSTLTVVVAFTQSSGDSPATGLTLSDISIYLTAINKSDGSRTVVWNGTQNPTFEVNNVGAYGRQYTGADLDTYDYVAGGLYGGASSLDQDYVSGATSEDHAGTWGYATRTLTQSAASVTSAVAGSVITVTRGDTFSGSLTGLGDISNRTKLWFTIKRDRRDAESASIVQVVLSSPTVAADGLLYLNGAAGTAAQGGIVVDDASDGDITITIDKAATAELEAASCVYDVQVLRSTGVVNTLTEAECDINADITRAIT